MTKDLLFLSTSVVGFSIIHSLTASLSFKAWLRNKLSKPFYDAWFRLLYNLLSLVTLAPILLLALGESSLLWKLEGSIVYLFQLLRIAALLGILVSLQQIDWKSFIGIRQVLAYYQKTSTPPAPEKLVITGIYRFTRHPLYLFSILFLWSQPTMSLSWLLFSSLSTLYFIVGSLLEEKKMVLQFGDSYREYQRTVSWLIPLIPRRRV